ncbi:MAG: Phosphate transport system permease protein PstC 1 [Alphaproteobacteria bacterium MarineAlpha6_Bin2]|jgi:phosphate transport system permease protein|nr:MAG: Phosphate transport system permease protein PstC 1 [Alphaproteobacteria bacterium MarineAlpha6_Bin2]
MYVVIAILLFSFYGFYLGKKKSANLVSNKVSELHSTPIYHGYYIFLWCFVPSLIVLISWQVLDNYLIKSLVLNLVPGFETLDKGNINFVFEKIKTMATQETIDPFFYDEQLIPASKKYNWLTKISNITLFTVILSFLAIVLVYVKNKIQAEFTARVYVEKFIKTILFMCSVVAIFTTLGIVLSLLLESLRFFQSVSIFDFLFGTHWSPQIAIREDQVGSSGAFGSVPVLAGTLLITLIAMTVSVPVGLFSAIYLSDYAPRKVRTIMKPLLEILAGIPTVVYGFFAALTIGPFLRKFGESMGLDIVSESALAAGLVMGIMIIPFISSLSDDVINAVPQELKDGSYALGATKSETMVRVILPAALPGIIGSILLAVSRAIGETMIVVMAAGMSARLTANPFEAVTTVTVQIVTLLVGDQEFDNPKTLAAFALGLQLFLLTLFLNLFALKIVQKYREKYE